MCASYIVVRKSESKEDIETCLHCPLPECYGVESALCPLHFRKAKSDTDKAIACFIRLLTRQVEGAVREIIQEMA